MEADPTITVTIPADWATGLSQDELRAAVRIGLTQLRQQRGEAHNAHHVVQALLATGRVRRLPETLADAAASDAERETPPTLPGIPMSEIIVRQRRGEL